MPYLQVPPPPRSPWQILYGAAHALRRSWYRSRAKALPRPVVSVGNLHWGGTGKTPIVSAIAAHLRDVGLRPAILSRGYKSRGSGVRIVSTGEGPLLGPSVAGDEPVLLAGELPGVAVVVGPERHIAGVHAIERLSPPPDIFLLDDGFSHLRLRRDLDILVFPRDNPLAGGRLMPSGQLREPLSSVSRADALLLTGASTGEASELAEGLGRYGFTGSGFGCRIRIFPAHSDPTHPLPVGSRVLLVAGIARPERFFSAAEEQGYEISGQLAFPDHHDYPSASIQRIAEQFQATHAESVLTTAKDHVKLLGHLDLPLATLPIRAAPDPEFWTWLDSAIEQRASGDS